MNESQAIDLYRRRHPSIMTKKLHGNMFQASLPDIIAIMKTGFVIFMEFKAVSGTTMPWSKCRLNQHLTMLSMEKHGACVRYAVYSNQTERFYFLKPSEVQEGQTTQLERKTS